MNGRATSTWPSSGRPGRGRYEESVYHGEAAIRASAEAMRRLPFNLPPATARAARAARAAAGSPDEQGWVETMVPIESLRQGHTDLLKFGAEIEVLAPADLRQMFAHSSKALADLYLRTKEDAT